MKKDGSEYPPGTLRDLVLSLQKFLEVDGRNVKFLSDDKFRHVRVSGWLNETDISPRPWFEDKTSSGKLIITIH
jgi:hypothetical protein